MPTLITYQKFITTEITRELRLPEGENHQRIGTELATIDGITYVSLPDGATLPTDQPAEIAASIATPVLSAETISALKAASPHIRLINQWVTEKIAALYTLQDEIKLLRTAPSLEFEAYNAHAEACRAWGREEKAKFGL
jgi:hypothetical protein